MMATSLDNNCPVVQQLDKESNNPSQSLNEFCGKAHFAQVFNFTVTKSGFNCFAQIYDSEDVDSRVLKATALGIGKTKKAAKSEAAYILLQDPNLTASSLVGNKETEWHNHPVQDENNPALIEEIPVVENHPVPKNILHDLTLACLNMNHEEPTFEESFMGPPHKRQYTAVCKLGHELIENGHGFSKKQAKRVAAHKMFERITRKENIINVQVNKLKQNSSTAAAADHHHPPVTLNSVIANFQSRTGDKLNLLNNNERTNFTNFKNEYSLTRLLEDIAEEQKLSLDWMEFEESTQEENDKRPVYCLLSVSAEPNVVVSSFGFMLFWGHGETETTAKENAAASCLQFMQVATWKS